MSEQEGERPRHVPPILRTKGLKFLDAGITEAGNPYFLLGADSGKYRQVSIYLLVDSPGEIVYGYTVFDASTRTEITYHGQFGDPTKDTLGEIEGL